MSAIELPEIRSHGAGESIQGLAYFGSREGWHIALSVNRDSEALDRSNWEVITESVLAVPDDPSKHYAGVIRVAQGADFSPAFQAWCACGWNGLDWPDIAESQEDADAHNEQHGVDGLPDAAIERMSNDLCGWVDHLLVRPGSSAERKALEWREKLEDYPVANEDHYSELEWAEEWCRRCDRGTREDHDSEYFRSSRPCKFRSENDAEEIAYRWKHRHGG